MEFVHLNCRQNYAIGQLLLNDKIINTKNNKPPVLCLPCGRFCAKVFPWIFLRTLGFMICVSSRASYPLYLPVPVWFSWSGGHVSWLNRELPSLELKRPTQDAWVLILDPLNQVPAERFPTVKHPDLWQASRERLNLAGVENCRLHCPLSALRSPSFSSFYCLWWSRSPEAL